jgi:hypothetical protein
MNYEGKFESFRKENTEEILISLCNNLTASLENLQKAIEEKQGIGNATISGDLADIRSQISDLYKKI